MAYRQQPPKPVGGFYPQTKVYSDGSHYIAIPHTERPYRPKRKHVEEVITIKEESPEEVKAEPTNESDAPSDGNAAETLLTLAERPPEEVHGQTGESSQNEDNGLVNAQNNSSLISFDAGQVETQLRDMAAATRCERKLTRKELFNELYAETVGVKKAERRKKIVAAMRPYFKDEKSATEFVNNNFERKRRNLISRRIRLSRKINLQDFNYFVTFTYSDALHTEDTFRKKLKVSLTHLCSRKGWKYVGVWERSPKKKRLHFHGLFNIPQGTMPGFIIEVNDYSLSSHRRQITHQNTYFNDNFGRSDFETIDDSSTLGRAVAYIMKYIEKTGEKIVYSKGLPQYFISDIMTDDIICPIGVEDGKLLLYDNFTCWDEGVLIGTVCGDVIRQLRTSN